jgi:hypothetical protein
LERVVAHHAVIVRDDCGSSCRQSFDSRALCEVACLLVRCQQRLDFALQGSIVSAGLAEKARPFVERPLEHRLEQMLHTIPADEAITHAYHLPNAFRRTEYLHLYRM